MIKVYVPRDSAARSVGADEVAPLEIAKLCGVRDRPQRLARAALA